MALSTDLSLPGVVPIVLTRNYRQADNISSCIWSRRNAFLIMYSWPVTAQGPTPTHTWIWSWPMAAEFITLRWPRT